jgi:hypothetical protein
MSGFETHVIQQTRNEVYRYAALCYTSVPVHRRKTAGSYVQEDRRAGDAKANRRIVKWDTGSK